VLAECYVGEDVSEVEDEIVSRDRPSHHRDSDFG
jgi:hypothetical protein